MDSRGADAPRRLRVLDVAEGAAAGRPDRRRRREVGVLTSVAGTRALGYVQARRRSGRIVSTEPDGSAAAG